MGKYTVSPGYLPPNQLKYQTVKENPDNKTPNYEIIALMPKAW